MAAEGMAAAEDNAWVISVGLSEGNIDTITLLNDLVLQEVQFTMAV